MNKKNLLFALLSFLVLSCDNDKNDKVEFTENHIQKETENCIHDKCAVADINYLLSEDNSLFAENFNKKITSSIITFVCYKDDDKEKVKTIEEAVNLYLKDYEREQENFSTGQELILSDSVSYQNKKLVSLKSERYSFVGGPHGLSEIIYYNFDASNGELLPASKLFTNEKAVTEIAEKYFKKEKNMQPNQSYDDAGFWFENGYQLPGNVGFTENEMILQYNPYEIAPYSDGPTTIHVPISEIKEWLTFFE